jgi:DNA-binding response OmpR family regulator
MQTEKKKVLIVEDEWKIARFLQMELEHEGYETALEQNGLMAYNRIIQENFDLILLDIMLPGMDGLEICKKVRILSSVPIIMLTAKDEVNDKVQGLDIGADDYLTKPFAMQELLARVRAVFRKHSDIDAAKSTETVLRTGNLALYPERYEALVDGDSVNLTKKEYDLLEFLLRNKNIVLGRERIIQEVWGYDYIGDTNVVDVYIRYLRSKIDDHFGHQYIHTVRGVGYVVKD